MNLKIEPMQRNDWQEVHTIYAEGIATQIASFVEEAPAWEAWDAAYLSLGRFVARKRNNKVIGWAALSPISNH